MAWTIYVAGFGAGLAGLCGLFCDFVLKDRARAAYHIAWMAAFLALIALVK